MKHALYPLCTAALVLTLAACADNDWTDVPQSGKVRMEFSAGTDALTRTQLTEGNAVLWEAGDAVSLFDPAGANNRFTTAEGGEKVIFEGTATETAGIYYALYPYAEAASVSGSSITTLLPAFQTARAGSFASGLNPSVAMADARQNLAFKNTCALVKFTLDTGSTTVHRAVLHGNGGEPLAGTLHINAVLDNPVAAVDAEWPHSEVELAGDFVSGNTYYMVVAPAALDNGLTLVLYNEQDHEWTKTANRAVTLSAGRILNLGTVTPDVFSPSAGYEVIDGVYHIHNAAGLLAWAGQTDVMTADVVLEGDIDMTGKSWIPIGNNISADDGYSGSFDGNGKRITGLSVTVEGNAGLFGGLAQGSRVHDVRFSQAVIESNSTSSCAGVVAGISLGVIDRCEVENSTVSGHYAGALVGNNSTQVNNCLATNVTVTASYAAGGIAGVSYGKVEYCDVLGSGTVITANGSSARAGGIVGYTAEEASITTSGRLLKCAVEGITVVGAFGGGIAGENEFGIIAQCVTSHTSVYHNSTASSARLGGVVGYNTRGDVVASYAANSSIGVDGLTAEAVGGIVGYNNNGAAYIYGCYATQIALGGIATSNIGSIAGYTSGHITSCYAVLSEAESSVPLVGRTTSFTPDHCVEAGATNYATLVDNVPDLTVYDGSVWKAISIWNFTAGAVPLIQSDYTGEAAGL